MQNYLNGKMNRRKFLLTSTLTGSSFIAADLFTQKVFAQSTPSLITSNAMRPQIPYGVASGDVTQGSGIIWSRCDRPAQMIVEYTFNESFARTRRVLGPVVTAATDFTGRIDLRDLPNGRRVYYRVTFQDVNDFNLVSEPVRGSFQHSPMRGEDIRFVWSGDQAGQGWGINPDFGGMKIFETMRQLKPHFFIHSGDTVYADNPLSSEVTLPNGTIWHNITTEEKSKVAETLKEFRGQYLYNLLDNNFRQFNAEVPTLAQWDDHEATNNWFPNEILTNIGGDARYTEKNVAILAARARQAFLEYQPIRQNRFEPGRIYRSFSYGQSLDVFMIDLRSYRGDNSPNQQTTPSDATAILGSHQIAWLKRNLMRSNATWKVIASDMPIGLIVSDGPVNFEAIANVDGHAVGRELEIADLLRFIRDRKIQNVVWLTADVHYCASHYYDPNRAQFQEFSPFWEFVSGPLHAGSFGPNRLDNTFGPQVKFFSAPPPGVFNLPPSAGLQFFGLVKIDAQTEVMTVSHYNINGQILDTTRLVPEK